MKKVKIIFSLIDRHKKIDFPRIAIDGIRSLIKTGFCTENIWCMCGDNKSFKIVRKKFPKINVYKLKEKLKGKRRGWHIKPIALYEFIHINEIESDCLYVISDIDTIFNLDPSSQLLSQKTDIWVTRAKRYLRRRRKEKLLSRCPSAVNPSMNNFHDLREYMGSVNAYFCIKQKWKSLPSLAIRSGFVSIKPHCFRELIINWYKMWKKTFELYRAGDQCSLDSAIHYLKLSLTVKKDIGISHMGSKVRKRFYRK